MVLKLDFQRGIEKERKELKQFANIGVAVMELNRRRMDIQYGLCMKICIRFLLGVDVPSQIHWFF